jgi:nucleotide-binding universal stress UspA family protein
MSDTFVIGFDGTETSQRAVAFGAARAEKTGAKLHLVHILEWSPYSFHTPEELAERHKRREEELERAKELVEPVVADLKAKGFDATSEVRHGHAAQLLCEIAEDRSAAQIIIGRTGESAFAARLLGSLANSLAQASPVPVTIVP